MSKNFKKLIQDYFRDWNGISYADNMASSYTDCQKIYFSLLNDVN